MQYPPFIKNSTYYKMDRSRTYNEQLLALSENLKKLHYLATSNYHDFDELIEAYLRAGIDIFQMTTGIVSNIKDDRDYIVKAVITNLDMIHTGDVFELEGTYCREVAKTRSTIGFPHVGEIPELKQHPVYVNLKLEAYISAPIFVNDILYGTLNFTSLHPREFGFSEQEHDFISMMAQSIGNFILLQEKEEGLKRLNQRMKELVGHLSHDLRNPLGAILSTAKVLNTYQLDESKQRKFIRGIYDEAAHSLELVNMILDTSAMQTGKIQLEKEPLEYIAIIDDSLKRANDLMMSSDLSIEIDNTAKGLIYADSKRMFQLFYNLILNACKYAKNGSVIHMKITDDDSRIRFSLGNYKENTLKQLDEARYRSIGYGQDIVKEVLQEHDSALSIKEDLDYYEVVFSLPRN